MPDAPIRGDGYTIQQLFNNYQFRLDSYQREYSWGRDDVRALLDDLTGHFLLQWTPGQERRETASYRPYFLGPFVYYRDGEWAALVDGQQRITTLHLLLLHLRRLALESGLDDYRVDLAALEPLIAGNSYGERAYAIDSDERAPVLEAIYEDKPYSLPPAASPSVKNLYERSQEIDAILPESIRDEALPLFIHWLLNRVCLVGINALDRTQGWEIFETMNDRGVQLGPADLLKSFLLRKANNVNNLARLGEVWRAMMTRLSSADQQGTTKFLQSLLIGKYAASIEDARDVLVSFHGWVQEHAEQQMGLVHKPDFARFIERDLKLLADRFVTLTAAGVTLEGGLEPVFYNSRNEINQMPFILAALDPADTEAQFREKSRLVAAFLDLVYARMVVNNKVDKSDLLYVDLFDLIPALRECRDIDSLAKLLGRRTAELLVDFAAVKSYGLRPQNLAQMRYLLARLTSFVETEAGKPNEMDRYLDKEEPYEVEHIWANKFERHQAEVKTEAEFRVQRNRFGALLLLRKTHNASYQAAPYEQKVEYYRGQNYLAASLHAVTHQRNRPFTEDVVKKYNLVKLFHSFDQFKKSSIDIRQQLYERLCEVIWDPKRLGFLLPASPIPPERIAEQAVAKRTRAHFGGVTVARLVAAGALVAGEELAMVYKRIQYYARITGTGQIEITGGERFDSPSPAGSSVTGKPTVNGWSAWKVKRDGKLVTLFAVRADALARGLLDGDSPIS